MAVPQNDIDRCGLSWATKVIASGVFFTGREPDEIFRRSCNWMAAPEHMLREALEQKSPAALLALAPEIDVQLDQRTVSVALNGITAYAKEFGDQGFSVVDGPDMGPQFSTQAITRPNIDAPWPLGDPDVVGPAATGADAELLRKAADGLFENAMQFTNACVVLHKGQVILERYRPPFGRHTQFESWSMGKSIAATLAGISIYKGNLSLDEDHLFDEWTDDRKSISLRHLLNMASGLQFSGSFGADEDHAVKSENGLYHDHTYVYASGVDSHQFCLGKTLADAPGTAGRYRNCDPLLTTNLVRDRSANGDVEGFLHWPYRELFNKIGATGMLLETDPYGSFLISGHDYGRAIDWARLGQLHLNRGIWNGQQLFSDSFAEFVRTPAIEAWKHDPYYGGFFPTNATGINPGLPSDAFWMSGGGIQRVVIVPSCDLVIVRMGHMAGQIFGAKESFEAFCSLIVTSVSNA